MISYINVNELINFLGLIFKNSFNNCNLNLVIITCFPSILRINNNFNRNIYEVITKYIFNL
jgi:hypothetical protein